MSYKHIIFDVDGTLLDSEKATITALQETIRELKNKEVPYEDLKFTYGIPGFTGLAKLGFENTDEALLVWNKYIAKNKWMVDWFKGLKDVVIELGKRGFELGIVTSRVDFELEADAKIFDFYQYFRIMVNSCDTLRHKPYGDPLIKYLELANIKKEEALYLGDTEYDYLCAMNAGVDFLHAKWGSYLVLDGARTVDHPEDLLELLK